MITLTATIEVFSNRNENIHLDTERKGNNISKDLSRVMGVKKKSENPFIIGSNKVGDGSTCSSGVDYFIGSQLCDSSGDFGGHFTIDLFDDSLSIKSFKIAFDAVHNRYPKSLFLDGDLHYLDSPIFTAVVEPKAEHSIQIGYWNTPYSPIVITGVYVDVELKIDRTNIVSLERSIFDRSDLKLPSFGIISNAGHIEFNDSDGSVLDYAEGLLLDKGLRCEIKLSNTLVEGASQTIAVMETDQWEYDNDNRLVSVSLKDDLEEWQDINVEGINYDARRAERKNFRWLYNKLWDITNKNYPMLRDGELDKTTFDILNNTYMKYPLLESGTLWQQWTKLCEACQLHIYKNNEGIVVCRYNGGN